jgi:hypothetical protein
MRWRVTRTWVCLIALTCLWGIAESGWESTGALVLDISRSMQDNDPITSGVTLNRHSSTSCTVSTAIIWAWYFLGPKRG